MIDLGTVVPGRTLRIPFNSYDKDDGSSVTMTNFVAGDILIYKDGSTTERASTAGFTATTDFDGKTGKHLAIIDLADDTTADFFKAGSEYLVAIDAVTVDAVTTGGWIARFRIGYPNAYFDTSIATLASQTSFTLTAGPAEDDALNGMVLLVHDKASAIQVTRVVVEDYTGSTKTVTLRAAPATTFTIAAGDNVSGIGFDTANITHVSGTAVTWSATRGLAGTALPAAAAGAAGGIPLSTAGSLDLDAQRADVAAILVDTGTTLDGRIPAALVGGRMDANVGAISSDATAADNAEAFFDGTGYAGTGNVIPTVTTLTGHTAQTGDCFARLGAPAGASVSADVAAVKTDTGNLVTRITANLFAGITKMAEWLGLIAGKQTGDATARTEIRATGAGSGTFDETTDSAQAIRDRGDAAWVTATGFSTLDAAGVRSAVGLGSANLDTQLAAIQADLPQRITKNTALAGFTFFMRDSTTHLAATGLTVTAQRSIDGAALGACANAVAEVGNGVYKIDLAAADLNGNVIMLRFTATGADDCLIGPIPTQPT